MERQRDEVKWKDRKVKRRENERETERFRDG